MITRTQQFREKQGPGKPIAQKETVMNNFGITVEYCKTRSVEASCTMTSGAHVRIRDYDSFAAQHDYADGRGQLTRVRRGVGHGVSRVGFAFARELARRELALIEAERKDAEIIAASLIAWFDAAQIDGCMWGGDEGIPQWDHPMNVAPDAGAARDIARPSYFLKMTTAHYLPRCTLGQAIIAALFLAGRPMVESEIVRKETRIVGARGPREVDITHHVWRLATGQATDVGYAVADIAAWKSIL